MMTPLIKRVFNIFWISTKYKEFQIRNTSQLLQIWFILNWLHFNCQQHKVKYLVSPQLHKFYPNSPYLFKLYTTIYYFYFLFTDPQPGTSSTHLESPPSPTPSSPTVSPPQHLSVISTPVPSPTQTSQQISPIPNHSTHTTPLPSPQPEISSPPIHHLPPPPPIPSPPPPTSPPITPPHPYLCQHPLYDPKPHNHFPI